MMNTLFGYRIKNGSMAVVESEANIIRRVVQSYISGSSLKQQAERLTTERVEHAHGQWTWTKNRVQRLLTNRTYLGDVHHAPILDAETFEEVQRIMHGRNTQKNCNRDKIFSSAVVPILCGNCRAPAVRRHERHWSVWSRYICQNPECRKAYSISDEQMWIRVQELLILDDERDIETPIDVSTQMEYHRLDHEVERELHGLDIDGEALKSKIFACAALQYETLNDRKKESMDFRNETPCSSAYIREIKRRVSAVLIDRDDKIRLRLADNRVIGKEEKVDGAN